jgi:hypothetical protein
MGADEQAWNVEALSYLDGGGHTVAIVCQSDVHQHEIRPHPLIAFSAVAAGPTSSWPNVCTTGTILQIPADITHCLPPKRKDVRMTERADRFTQDHMSCTALGKKTLAHGNPANCLGRDLVPQIKHSRAPLSVARERHSDISCRLRSLGRWN